MKNLNEDQYQLYGALLKEFPHAGPLIMDTMTKDPDNYGPLRDQLESARDKANGNIQRLISPPPITLSDEQINTAGQSDGRENGSINSYRPKGKDSTTGQLHR